MKKTVKPLERIFFSWHGESYREKNDKRIDITATKGTKFTIDWGDSVIKTFTGSGKREIIYHCYKNIYQKYEVTIIGITTDCFFTAIDLYGNRICFLDISEALSLQELSCSENYLTEIDLSKNTVLKKLYCSNNKLKKLDVSNNKALEILDCSGNKLLTNLNLSENILLKELYCGFNEIEYGEAVFTKEGKRRFRSIYNLKSLDLSKNKSLESLSCPGNKLTELNLGTNSALTFLNCPGNKITELDLSENISLTYVLCQDNKLIELNLSANRALLPQIALKEHHH